MMVLAECWQHIGRINAPFIKTFAFFLYLFVWSYLYITITSHLSKTFNSPRVWFLLPHFWCLSSICLTYFHLSLLSKWLFLGIFENTVSVRRQKFGTQSMEWNMLCMAAAFDELDCVRDIIIKFVHISVCLVTKSRYSINYKPWFVFGRSPVWFLAESEYLTDFFLRLQILCRKSLRWHIKIDSNRFLLHVQ
jgi:hypothetical protein